jgi:hypothetical protein
MFADPMSVDFLGEKAFARIDSGRPNKGTWVFDDGAGLQLRLDVSQNSTAARFRREIRITRTKVAADPLTAVNKEVSASVILSFDEPRYGFSDADLSGMLGSLTDTLADDSGLVVTKLLNGES